MTGYHHEICAAPISASNSSGCCASNRFPLRESANLSSEARRVWIEHHGYPPDTGRHLREQFQPNAGQELIAYAKASPGMLNYASAGAGSPQHLCVELFKMMTGVDMAHVPYRGGAPAVTDMIAGHVQVMFDFPASSLEHIRAGKLRALAMTSAKQWPGLPDLPTVGDFLSGFEATFHGGIVAPKSTPNAVIERLNGDINVMLADPGMKARFAEVGEEPLMGSPTEFANLIEADADKWPRVIRAANVKLG